jgi:hypothetical protein
MAQQLNLYDTSLRPPRVLLTPLRLGLALVLLWLLLWGVAQWLQRDAQRWQQQAQAHQAQITELGAALAALPASSVEAELVPLRQQLAQAQLLTQAQAPAAQRQLPAEVMQALSQAAPGDVWLQQVSWQLQPRRLDLEGGLLDARRLPDYLRRLERQPALAGLQFGLLQLEPTAAGAPPSFVLRSQVKEAAR